ncbi:Protein yippee-like [Aphelenchoides fujianensis]|nr:Protein yippee-like [Aphelenchoides fujianensis]
MGRPFLEHFGGDTTFHCAGCSTYLTNRDQIYSEKFQGATGPAYLFRRVVNLALGPLQERDMLTGLHIVRDASCRQCGKQLGWMYEFACQSEQRYKEGYFVLEQKLLRMEEELNPALAQSTFPPPAHHCGSFSSTYSIESDESSGVEFEEN